MSERKQTEDGKWIIIGHVPDPVYIPAAETAGYKPDGTAVTGRFLVAPGLWAMKATGSSTALTDLTPHAEPLARHYRPNIKQVDAAVSLLAGRRRADGTDPKETP